MKYSAGPDLEKLIVKVVSKIKGDKDLQSKCSFGPWKSDAYALEDAAGNHAFDDYPEWFDITEDDGHKIRGFFQHYSLRNNKEQEAYIQSLCDSASDGNLGDNGMKLDGN